jgi:flagellar motor switch protein FliG
MLRIGRATMRPNIDQVPNIMSNSPASPPAEVNKISLRNATKSSVVDRLLEKTATTSPSFVSMAPAWHPAQVASFITAVRPRTIGMLYR